MVAPSPSPENADTEPAAASKRQQSYPGSKGQAGTWRRICALMPRHRVFVEAFLGSGVILGKKRPAEWELAVELNPGVVEEWPKRPHYRPGPIVITGNAMDVFQAIAAGDVAGLFAGHPSPPPAGMDPKDILVYVDAPYPLECRTDHRLYYEREFTDGDLAADRKAHRQLLTTLIGLPCRVMVSCYWNPLYVSMLQEWQKWRAEGFRSQTRGGVSQEWLWMNFPADVPLHDTAHVGRNYRERERIKRKKKRWVEMFSKMPPAERQAIADALAEVEGKLRATSLE
jgi:hypothetical protein